MNKLKVGDWICRDNYVLKITKITDYAYHDDEGKALKLDQAKLWQPKVGEWCWYGFELVEVIDTTNPLKICRQQSDSYEEVSVTMLEPFVNKLPTVIKDK